LGRFQFAVGGFNVDGAAELGAIDEHRDFIGFHFSKATQQSDGLPAVAVPQTQHTGIQGCDQ
jgi:hypothetical protein